MAEHDIGRPGGLSRRDFVRGLGATGVSLAAAPALWIQPDTVGTGAPEQLHLQFGSDASREVIASWVTPASVRRPVLRLGTPEGGFGRLVEAETRTYVDSASSVEG